VKYRDAKFNHVARWAIMVIFAWLIFLKLNAVDRATAKICGVAMPFIAINSADGRPGRFLKRFRSSLTSNEISERNKSIRREWTKHFQGRTHADEKATIAQIMELEVNFARHRTL